MRKTFKKYFTSLVFILLSGLLLLHANAISGRSFHTLSSNSCKSADPSNPAAYHFSPASHGFSANVGRILIEDTEFEDLDHSSDSDNFNPDFFYNTISALFHFSGWEHTLKSRKGLIAYQYPLAEHCKRHIRFGVFRI